MSITRHAPDPLHVRETLCGQALERVGHALHVPAAVGDTITCVRCKVVIDMATKCVSPSHYVLARAP